jgi:hypothetical protein
VFASKGKCSVCKQGQVQCLCLANAIASVCVSNNTNLYIVQRQGRVLCRLGQEGMHWLVVQLPPQVGNAPLIPTYLLHPALHPPPTHTHTHTHSLAAAPRSTEDAMLLTYICAHPTLHFPPLLPSPVSTPRSTEEAEALRVLLEQQSESAAAAAAGGRVPPSGLLYLEPSRELSLQDLDTLDQTSPGKHDRAAAAAAMGVAAAKGGKPPRHGSAAAAAGPGGGVAARWGLRDNAAALSSSSGARCSSNEGR